MIGSELMNPHEIPISKPDLSGNEEAYVVEGEQNIIEVSQND